MEIFRRFDFDKIRCCVGIDKNGSYKVIPFYLHKDYTLDIISGKICFTNFKIDSIKKRYKLSSVEKDCSFISFANPKKNEETFDYKLKLFDFSKFKYMNLNEDLVSVADNFSEQLQFTLKKANTKLNEKEVKKLCRIEEAVLNKDKKALTESFVEGQDIIRTLGTIKEKNSKNKSNSFWR